jgi:hypothetical protein
MLNRNLKMFVSKGVQGSQLAGLLHDGGDRIR